jgi:hypothetical protein
VFGCVASCTEENKEKTKKMREKRKRFIFPLAGMNGWMRWNGKRHEHEEGKETGNLLWFEEKVLEDETI